ncbi:hypothetical protein [Clostridium saccharobutylicum]|uniref:Uncharacterized protein n=1 Tax=Clostridium saccharobutylicum DSM 13864 TaxID=1345695 RepID=U5MS60_CLOSA|nr:hypothetical protein [Clostridium saccharobutylicum]AGX43639.1 hypothetical protein CLSA_c26680 [Clostridium saccharobutylicum DSM 13864]AQR90937.1 hypothetical protein CLOSC_26580 [Clostridium saccharobutylicum]AQS00841.1 hypothetical protein CSACC_26650 [Clostridium saccharobutylicum]AQS14824.1 hypothetical protein CLOSACC_26650 [Clostridium saccharobutylicum]MBA2905911.1 hypothetical protein [Clostridium saccharobutylicum]
MEDIISYKCLKCGITENIPREVVEYFYEMDQSNIDKRPCFAWEKCGGVMRTKEYNGLYGKNYNI